MTETQQKATEILINTIKTEEEPQEEEHDIYPD